MTAVLLILAALWVASGVVGALGLLSLAYADELRIRLATRRMWRELDGALR